MADNLMAVAASCEQPVGGIPPTVVARLIDKMAIDIFALRAIDLAVKGRRDWN